MKRALGLGSAALGIFALACGASDDPGGDAGHAGTAGVSAVAGASQAGAAPMNTGGSGSGVAGSGVAGSGVAASGNVAGAGGSAAGAGAGSGVAGTASAGSGAGGSAPVMQPFKGLAYNTLGATNASCDDLKKLGVSWYYSWSGTPTCTVADIEFVPMVWGSWKKLNWVPTPAKAVEKGAKYLLGFNEPDGAGQANMSVAEAITLWADFQLPGVLLGSPSVAGQEEWLPSFMTEAAKKQLRVDFIALHWYGWNPNSCNDVTALENKIKWAEQWNRPIWITEWSCRLQSAAVTQKFFTDALAMFQKHPRVERYAWFLSRSNGEFADAALLDGSGQPTPLGKLYQAAPSTR